MPIDFKSIKALFIVEEPEASKRAEVETPKAEQVATAHSQPSPIRAGEANPKLIEELVKSMEATHWPWVE